MGSWQSPPPRPAADHSASAGSQKPGRPRRRYACARPWTVVGEVGAFHAWGMRPYAVMVAERHVLPWGSSVTAEKGVAAAPSCTGTQCVPF